MTVRPGDSKEARQARLERQFRQLAVVEADVILLQEVNPLPDMAEAYVAALERFGLQYAHLPERDDENIFDA